MNNRLSTKLVFFSDYGALGKVGISLPELIGSDADFDAEFEEILAFVGCVMQRRKRLRAKAIEARSGETERLDPKDESAVATPCAQSPSEDTE